jgi:protein O-mannosyl-transferase
MCRKRKPAAVAPAISQGHSYVSISLALLGMIALLCIVYQSAMHGPLLFDDRTLPFGQRQLRDAPLRTWILGVRPMLMLTYWLNYQFSGAETFGYHVLNLLLHGANGLLVFLLCRAFLPNRPWLCGFGAASFLLHPLQTESVAYLAGRSELVVAFFLLCSTLVFVRVRRPTWGWAMLVTALLGAALLSKEQASAAIALFLLLESGWMENSPDLLATLVTRIRNHWRLWGLLAALGCVAAALIWAVLSESTSAGFHVAGRPFTAYFFTECRVIFQYLRLFVLPIGQNIDPHPPLSYTPLEHGAVFWLAGIGLLVWMCFRFRRVAPLATFGFLTFLILLAPTSSFVPLNDPMAEHRMYLPVMGLCLITVDLLARVNLSGLRVTAAVTCVLAVYAALSSDRARVWSTATALAEDAAARLPLTTRSVTMLAMAYLSENRAKDFLDRIALTPPPGLEKDPYMLNWVGVALSCVERNEEAVDRLQKALAIRPEAVGFGLKGFLEAKLGRTRESLEDLNRAIQLEPDFDVGYCYRGLWYLAANELGPAADDFQHALALNPMNPIARDGLLETQRRQTDSASQNLSTE